MLILMIPMGGKTSPDKQISRFRTFFLPVKSRPEVNLCPFSLECQCLNPSIFILLKANLLIKSPHFPEAAQALRGQGARYSAILMLTEPLDWDCSICKAVCQDWLACLTFIYIQTDIKIVFRRCLKRTIKGTTFSDVWKIETWAFRQQVLHLVKQKTKQTIFAELTKIRGCYS